MNFRITILKWFLRVSALFQVIYWSVSHLFFPQLYYASIGGQGFVEENRYSLLFMNEIGVLTLGIGLATWLASFDPVRNVSIVISLCVVAAGSICLSLYHILFQRVAPGEWITVVVILLQLAVLTLLYPWKEAANYRTHPHTPAQQ